MDLSREAVDAIAQIIPVLLLASFLDKEILGNVRKMSVRYRLSVLGYILFILLGETLAIIGLTSDGLSGWQAVVVVLAAAFSVGSLLNVATYRLCDSDILTSLPRRARK